MGKHFHRRIKQGEQNHKGCMSGFITMFDFRRAGHHRRLLPEKRFLRNRIPSGAIRNMKESDYIFGVDECDGTQPMLLRTCKPSVKKLMEQDMVTDDERTQNTNEEHNRDFCLNKPQPMKRQHSLLSSVPEPEHFEDNIDVNNEIQEIFSRIQQKYGDGVAQENDNTNDFCVLPEKKPAKSEKMLIGAAEVILREKRLVGEDEKIHYYSREFIDAMRIIILHKVMFFELLEDPNSAFTRRVKYILKTEPRTTEGSDNLKHELFSRRRDGFLGRGSDETLSAAIADNNPLKTKSIFSFTEIKRRLKHAMGKDRNGASIVKKVMRPSGETVPGRMSPSRNPHLEAEIHPKRLSSPRKSETESQSPSQQKMATSNVDIDPASKHSSPKHIDNDDHRRSSSASDRAMDSSCTSPAADKKMSNEDENISAESSTVTLSESDDTLSRKLESSNPSSIISEYKDFDEDYESQYSVEMSPEGDTEDLTSQRAGVTLTPEKLHTDESTESAESCNTVISEDTFTDSDEQVRLALVDDVVTKMEKPSPVSILEIIYLEDETSPPSTKILQSGLPVVSLQIRFDEDEPSESEKSTSDHEAKRRYIQEILTLSDFSWDNVYLKSLSSDQILDEDLDILSDRQSNSYKHKLLIDCVNEVLMEASVRSFGGFPLTSVSKQNIRIKPIPDADEAFREIWQGVERHLRPLSPPRNLEQMVENDLIKDSRWMDLRIDAETICNEIEDIIFQELLEDLLQ